MELPAFDLPKLRRTLNAPRRRCGNLRGGCFLMMSFLLSAFSRAQEGPPPRTPMAAWKQAYFTPEQLADGTSDDTAAPQGDGWVNLLKYAFAMQPFELPSAWMPRPALEDGHLTLSYHRPIYIGD
jgi:hypothetical protein